MLLIKNISDLTIPLLILIILIYGIKEKISVFDLFLKGAIEGIEITVKILPTLVGLFFAIGLLRSSNILDLISNILYPVIKIFQIPIEIVPLALIRPISGSGAIALATDIIKTNGVDSFVGKLSAVIMGATETTIYTIAVYSSSVKIKKTRFVLLAALIADFVGIISATIICNILFK